MSTVPTEAPASRSIDVDLLFHQDDELFDFLHFLLFICGGRGSGKSYTDRLHFLLRALNCVDQPYGLFANTDAQLHHFITLLTEYLDFLGLRYVFATRAPKSWRKRWRRAGIIVPARRVRNEKFLIVENGLHIFCCSMLNNSYTRAKSLDLMFALVEEGTEPGVTEAAWDTIIGCVRCGVGVEECKRRGHNHQVVIKFNVPLNDPSHFVFKKHEQLKAKELQRIAEKKKPFYRLISSSTRDNPHTGDYDERLRAAWDAETYEQQTSGKLERNVSQLSYHAFSDQNILPLASPGIVGLSYSPVRPLHLWFDFNRRPAVAGWGHDLNTGEVPTIFLRTDHEYFGVNGELFSGQDTLLTDAVAQALLDDPSRDAKAICRDCDHSMERHITSPMLGQGEICRLCNFHRGEGKNTTYCQAGSKPMEKREKDYIHAAPNWRGLRNHRADIYVYGDASGKSIHADSVAGSSREILRGMLTDALGERVHFRFKEANPPIALRLLAVNRGLCAKNGVRSIFFADYCTEHIADNREVVPGLDGNPKKTQPTAAELKRGGGYWLRTHSMDGFGYFYDFRWPAVIPSAGGGLPSVGDPVNLGPMATNWRPPS